MKTFLDANICLDLLDTTRPTSKQSAKWYMQQKDNLVNEFSFSSDFITTFYYILTEKRKYDAKKTLQAIDMLSDEIKPHYLIHADFINAKEQFFNNTFEDFEDLLILTSASRANSNQFITNDKKLLQLSKFQNIAIVSP
jgi:predicted nucleic acid-binding protein